MSDLNCYFVEAKTISDGRVSTRKFSTSKAGALSFFKENENRIILFRVSIHGNVVFEKKNEVVKKKPKQRKKEPKEGFLIGDLLFHNSDGIIARKKLTIIKYLDCEIRIEQYSDNYRIIIPLKYADRIGDLKSYMLGKIKNRSDD